jgi:hypothetical protein
MVWWAKMVIGGACGALVAGAATTFGPSDPSVLKSLAGAAVGLVGGAIYALSTDRWGR